MPLASIPAGPAVLGVLGLLGAASILFAGRAWGQKAANRQSTAGSDPMTRVDTPADAATVPRTVSTAQSALDQSCGSAIVLTDCHAAQTQVEQEVWQVAGSGILSATSPVSSSQALLVSNARGPLGWCDPWSSLIMSGCLRRQHDEALDNLVTVTYPSALCIMPAAWPGMGKL
jgi:hypothetical protein